MKNEKREAEAEQQAELLKACLKDTRRHDCGHYRVVHSKVDGRCLGGTKDKPMSCKCVL